MSILKEDLMNAAQTSQIDWRYGSKETLRTKLLYNNIKEGTTVLANITESLRNCDSFWFSVAFITKSGLATLKQQLLELQEAGIQGKILTTDYLTFTEPDALKDLLNFDNIEVRIYTKENFHTKGYMFEKDDERTFIVGSSNLTQSALKANKEWNMKVSSLQNGELIKESLEEFTNMWDNAIILDDNWISEYTKYYKEKKAVEEKEKISRIKTYTLKMNPMQIEATKALSQIRSQDKDKALLISATGTGKTYLSAFDVRNFKPNKMLFLVHREQILKQAEESFKDVLGDSISSGILSGKSKKTDVDYLFSTTSMMAKEHIRNQFSPTHFDYIIIDETHRAGAETYSRIIDYFHPKFLLGMTATPERTDEKDIYKIFDYNIAYEIRLQQALEENLLCPFHYFGISDLSINGKAIDDNTEFNSLITEERVSHIIEKIKTYGYSGNRVRGLIFCRTIHEAKELSNIFNTRGYNTIPLDGSVDQETRSKAISRLEQDSRKNGLDYIFTINVFNEGVDIPSVNQIVMLRPTQSSIIFIQQLGRGLRKLNGKEYLVVIDFIGNYENNFLIPIALSGDRSYNKDTLRKYISQGNRIIPGCSTVNFDSVTRKRIYEAIDLAKLNQTKFLKDEYFNLKNKLGHIPNINDFDKFGSIEINKYFDKFGSYYNFLKKYDKDNYHTDLSPEEEEIILFISQKLVKGKRIHELEMLEKIITHKNNAIAEYRTTLTNKYSISPTDEDTQSAINYLTNKFSKNSDKKKFNNCVFLEEDAIGYNTSNNFRAMSNNDTFINMIKELINYGKSQYKKSYSNRYKETNFELYKKYTYEDVCRLLNWKTNMNALNIGGYFYDNDTKTMPVFINYLKDDDSIQYEDRFLSPDNLIALSKHPRKITSSDAKHIYNEKEEGNKIYLFVRKLKDDNEAKEFYFLGQIHPIGNPNPIKMSDTNDDAFEINYQLEKPVREDIFEYITK